MAGDMGVNSLGDWEFPGDLAIRIPGFHCCGQGSILGWGTEILQAMQQGKKKSWQVNENKEEEIINEYKWGGRGFFSQ